MHLSLTAGQWLVEGAPTWGGQKFLKLFDLFGHRTGDAQVAVDSFVEKDTCPGWKFGTFATQQCPPKFWDD